jgi:hypothetical protein
VGDVLDGVFLRQRRIFLGGQSGLVGPRSVGYGSMTGAGQVVRRDVPAGRLSVQVAREVDQPLERPLESKVQAVRDKNVEYIAQLEALRAWYAGARLARARAAGQAALATVYEEALVNIGVCVAERVNRLAAYLRERGQTLPSLATVEAPPFPLSASGDPDHVNWVRALSDADVARARDWLAAITATVRARLNG